MSGGGIEELCNLIYAENCVEQILSGHSYALESEEHERDALVFN